MEQTGWNMDFHEISINYTEKLIQIKEDDKLERYLNQDGNGSLELAEYVKKTYQKVFGKKLQITKESLSVEILIHTYINVFSKNLEEIVKLLPDHQEEKLIACLKKIEDRAGVIDCGEKSIDSNRVIFDSLAPFRGMLYMLLGKKA